MSRSKRKRRLARRDKKEARQALIIGFAITVVFLILAYLLYLSGRA